jgi:WD repeat and SOF domain-containing protein 1
MDALSVTCCIRTTINARRQRLQFIDKVFLLSAHFDLSDRFASMKFKVIQRSLDDTMPAQLGAPAPQHRNLDPALHPFAKPREYQRALTAAKLERMFAKPFIDSLEGHSDGIYCSARDPDRLGCVATGAGDGGKANLSLLAEKNLVKS